MILGLRKMQMMAKNAKYHNRAFFPDPYLYVTIYKEFPVSTEFLKIADRGDL